MLSVTNYLDKRQQQQEVCPLATDEAESPTRRFLCLLAFDKILLPLPPTQFEV